MGKQTNTQAKTKPPRTRAHAHTHTNKEANKQQDTKTQTMHGNKQALLGLVTMFNAYVYSCIWIRLNSI